MLDVVDGPLCGQVRYLARTVAKSGLRTAGHGKNAQGLDPRSNPPAAVAARHHTQQALADVILKALAPLRPDVSAAGCQVSFSSSSGWDRRPTRVAANGRAPYYVLCDIVGGGMGGGPGTDGLTAVDTHGGNCAILSAEVLETIDQCACCAASWCPTPAVSANTAAGSAFCATSNAGRARRANLRFQQQCDDTAPWGFAGGGPGGKAAFVMNPGTNHEEKLLARVTAKTLRRGDVLRVVGAGAGGWGDPTERDPELIERDLAEGYVTAEASK